MPSSIGIDYVFAVTFGLLENSPVTFLLGEILNTFYKYNIYNWTFDMRVVITKSDISKL